MLLWPGQFWVPSQGTAAVRLTDVLEVKHVVDDGTIEIAIWRMVECTARNTRYVLHSESTVVCLRDVLAG